MHEFKRELSSYYLGIYFSPHLQATHATKEYFLCSAAPRPKKARC